MAEATVVDLPESRRLPLARQLAAMLRKIAERLGCAHSTDVTPGFFSQPFP